MLNEKLRIGTVITGASGRARGRIGAFVSNAAGDVLLLGARQTLFAERSRQIHVDGEPVASRVTLQLPGRAPREGRFPPLFEMIAAAKLDVPPPPLAMAIGETLVSDVVHPLDALGSNVFKVLASGRRPQGRVSALGGSVTLRDHVTGSVRRYDDVVEVRFDDAGEAPQEGEGGALIVDERDRALGLLIGVSRNICLVAPLAPFLEAYGLALSNLPPRGAGAPSDLGALRTELDGIAAHLRDWLGEMRAEGVEVPIAEQEPSHA